MPIQGDINTALQALNYARQAYNFGKLGTSVVGAAMSGGGAISPATGLGAVAAPMALASLANTLINRNVQKHRTVERKGQSQQMQQVGSLLTPQEGQSPKDWLDQDVSPTFGWKEPVRRGDLLREITVRNLRGDWTTGANVAGGQAAPFLGWVPNENLRPLAAALTLGGYTKTTPDPTALIPRAGGWGTGRDKYGLPQNMDPARGVDTWDKVLTGLASIVGKNIPQSLWERVPMEPREKTIGRLLPTQGSHDGQMYPIKDTLQENLRFYSKHPVNNYDPTLHQAITIAHDATYPESTRNLATSVLSRYPKELEDELTAAIRAAHDYLGDVSADAAP